MSPTTSYHRLSSHDHAGFEVLYALYQRALPEQEQKSRAQLLTMLETPGYSFLCAERAERLAGFAIIYLCQSTPLALLEYLAVAESERGNGLGANLVARGAQHAGERVLLVELDAPSASEPSSMRRSDFYRRQGWKRVAGLQYILPLPVKTPPAMWLLTLSARDALTRAELADWLRTLYSEVYHCELTDPRVDQMLAPLPEALRLVDLPELG